MGSGHDIDELAAVLMSTSWRVAAILWVIIMGSHEETHQASAKADVRNDDAIEL